MKNLENEIIIEYAIFHSVLMDEKGCAERLRNFLFYAHNTYTVISYIYYLVSAEEVYKPCSRTWSLILM